MKATVRAKKRTKSPASMRISLLDWFGYHLVVRGLVSALDRAWSIIFDGLRGDLSPAGA